MAAVSVEYSRPEKKLIGVQIPKSSESLRNSSKPNVPFGREKMSTQRSFSNVWWLERTDQDRSSRDDMVWMLSKVAIARGFAPRKPDILTTAYKCLSFFHRKSVV